MCYSACSGISLCRLGFIHYIGCHIFRAAGRHGLAARASSINAVRLSGHATRPTHCRPGMSDDADITHADFERLLRWLDEEHTQAGAAYDPERAGARYEKIRRRLIVVCASRGCREPETYADEVFRRVTRKVSRPDWSWDSNDPLSYFLAVLNLVLKEYWRLKPPPAPPVSVDETEDEARYECLEACLQFLPGSERDILLRYHQCVGREGIEGRRRLAEELRISRNALGIRVHRILLRLAACVRERLKERGES